MKPFNSLNPRRANAPVFHFLNSNFSLFFLPKKIRVRIVIFITLFVFSNTLLATNFSNKTSHVLHEEENTNASMCTFICQGISAPLMMLPTGGGMLELPATLFIDPTSCPDLNYFVTLNENNDPTTPPTTTTINFDCQNFGLMELAVWGCDNSGNCSFCVVEILITENGVCAFPDVAVAGFVDNQGGDGIQDVAVSVNYGQYMEMTDSDGNFDMTEIPMYGNYKIQPTKNTDFRNGVSTYDIVLISKHILGIALLDSPYKIIAADVNGSGEVTALDMVKIRNLILMNTNEFPNDMPSWRFVDADFVFSDPINPFASDFPEYKMVQSVATDLEDLNFVAIKLGDVTGNATPNLWNTDTRNTNGILNFKTQNQSIKKGEVVSLAFSTKEDLDLAAWQFTLSFESDLLEFLEVEKIQDVHFGADFSSEGNVTFMWNSDGKEVAENEQEWMSIQFLAKEDLTLENAIWITSERTLARGYDALGKELQVQLVFEKQDIYGKSSGLKLFPNEPNPFKTTTAIRYFLPQKGNVEITVFDATGKLIKQHQIFSEAGNQSFILKAEELNFNGLLFYQLKTSEEMASGKMMVSK